MQGWRGGGEGGGGGGGWEETRVLEETTGCQAPKYVMLKFENLGPDQVFSLLLRFGDRCLAEMVDDRVDCAACPKV